MFAITLTDKTEEEVANLVKQPDFSSTSTRNYSILNLEDGQRLFSSVPTVQLLRSSLNLHMITSDLIVDLGISVTKSRLLKTVVFREIVLAVVKHTFYKHFCARENVEEASWTLQKLWDDGLHGIWDYRMEDAVDNESCDRILQEFLNTVKATKLLPENES